MCTSEIKIENVNIWPLIYIFTRFYSVAFEAAYLPFMHIDVYDNNMHMNIQFWNNNAQSFLSFAIQIWFCNIYLSSSYWCNLINHFQIKNIPGIEILLRSQPNIVNTLLADSYSSRPSAGTLPTQHLNMISSNFLWNEMIPFYILDWHHLKWLKSSFGNHDITLFLKK